jgi:50S ribosomal protein L16 3-hydroxylase
MHILDSIGELSVDQFMRRHWQRAPLLARGAFPAFAPPIDPAGLFDLASRDDVESRLIASSGDGRTLRHGPFDRLPSRRRPGWTLLVQGVDLHDDAVHELMCRFRFVPDARVDDLMISFATDGGGVGPHVDQYDVFLLQGHGRRRWRIAPPGDASLVPDVPLKLLARFEPTQEWVLEPGDMLYLPPGWGHDGVAVGECTTLSIGFRAPSRQEFLSAFLGAAADAPGGADPRYGDRGLRPAVRPGELPEGLADRLRDWATGWRPAAADVDRFVGCFVTEPKPSVWFDAPASRTTPARFAGLAARGGLKLDRRTRMAWRGRWIFVNGEALEPGTAARRWLRRLADRRVLDAAECPRALAVPELAAILGGWHDAGWIRPVVPPAPRPAR